MKQKKIRNIIFLRIKKKNLASFFNESKLLIDKNEPRC
jgi:hypothetical protein